MTSFRERNPIPIGAIGLSVLSVLMVVAFNVESLPLIGGGDRFHASFSEAAGLKPRDHVRVAGVKVGEVESVELEGAHVRVDFRVEPDVELGAETRAEIRIATILGQKYVALYPEGEEPLPSGSEIPLSRTDAPYSVIDAFSGLTTRVQEIDSERLGKAFDTLATTFEDAPEEVRDSLRGLTRLSKTISSRNQKLSELLSHAESVSQVLAERNKEFVTLIRDADLLLRELDRRQELIHQLLVNTVRLSNQLTALVEENEEQLEPALQRLEDVVDILRRNEEKIRKSMELLAPFVREFTDTLGSGRWFDTYLQNVAPLPTSVRPPGN